MLLESTLNTSRTIRTDDGSVLCSHRQGPSPLFGNTDPISSKRLVCQIADFTLTLRLSRPFFQWVGRARPITRSRAEIIDQRIYIPSTWHDYRRRLPESWIRAEGCALSKFISPYVLIPIIGLVRNLMANDCGRVCQPATMNADAAPHR